MKYLVWEEVCKIPEEAMRVALLVCHDPGLVAKLQAAFPHCFSETPPKIIFPVPASELIEASREFLRDHTESDDLEYESRFHWEPICEKLGMPLQVWNGNADNILPLQIINQIVGQTWRPGISVKWRGAEWIVVTLNYWGKEGEPIVNDGTVQCELEYCAMTPASYIIMDI